VPELGRRLAEARRIGFSHAVVPAEPGAAPPLVDGLEILPAPDLATALRVLDLRPVPRDHRS